MPKTDTRAATPRNVRTSVTVSFENHEELERIAEQKKVSVAWVIREAIEQYINNDSPLFRRTPR